MKLSSPEKYKSESESFIRKYKLSKIIKTDLDPELISFIDYCYELFDSNITVYKFKSSSGQHLYNNFLNKIVLYLGDDYCYTSNIGNNKHNLIDNVVAVIHDLYPKIDVENIHINYPFIAIENSMNSREVEYTYQKDNKVS